MCARQTGDSLPGLAMHLRELIVRKASCGRCARRSAWIGSSIIAVVSVCGVLTQAPARPFPGRDVHCHLLIPRWRPSRDEGCSSWSCRWTFCFNSSLSAFTNAILHPVCCQFGPDSSLFIWIKNIPPVTFPSSKKIPQSSSLPQVPYSPTPGPLSTSGLLSFLVYLCAHIPCF